MPLVKSPSDKAFKANVRKEMQSGKPQKQALAIVYSTKRANMAKGGKLNRVKKHGSSGQMDQSHEVLGSSATHKKNPGSMQRNDQSPETFYRGGMTDDSREQHNSDAPDAMDIEKNRRLSQGGMAQPAGGEDASHRPTQDLYPHRANHAEGGMVDDQRSILPPMQKKMNKWQGADDGPVSHRPTMDQYAEGGEVDEMRSLEQDPEDGNEKLDPGNESHSDPENGSRHDPVEYGVMSEDSAKNLNSRTRPSESVKSVLVQSILEDRKRMARGGSVESYEDDHVSSHVGSLHGPIDEPTDSYMDNDSDEHNAPEQDGRYQRGLNAEPVHSMDDPRHDVSEASLVAEILRDRKNRRRS